MAILDEGRCGRCGADPFLAGTPYTIWVWFSRDPRDHGTEAMPLHLCRPCGREFSSTQERSEYLKAVAFG
jgi:hypothetical protein